MIRDVFGVNDVTCTGSVLRSQIVRIYDKCTQIATSVVANATKPIFAISKVSNTAVTQMLCSDSACQQCVSSTTAPSWPLSSSSCSVNGNEKFRGWYFSSAGPPSGSPNGGGGGGSGGNSTSSTDSAPASFSPVLYGVSIGLAVLVVIGIVIGGVYLYRRQAKGEIGVDLEPEDMSRRGSRRVSKLSVMKPAEAYKPRSTSLSRPQTRDSGRSTLMASIATEGIELTPLEQLRFDTLRKSQISTMGRSAVAADSDLAPRVSLIEYKPRKTDELQLDVGNRIVIESLWDNGWAQAFNLSTGQRGRMSMAAVASAPESTLSRSNVSHESEAPTAISKSTIPPTVITKSVI